MFGDRTDGLKLPIAPNIGTLDTLEAFQLKVSHIYNMVLSLTSNSPFCAIHFQYLKIFRSERLHPSELSEVSAISETKKFSKCSKLRHIFHTNALFLSLRTGHTITPATPLNMNVLSRMTPPPSSPVHHHIGDIRSPRSPRSPSTKYAGRYTHNITSDVSTPNRVIKYSPYPSPAEPTPLELRWIRKSMGRASRDDIRPKDAKMVSIYARLLYYMMSYSFDIG